MLLPVIPLDHDPRRLSRETGLDEAVVIRLFERCSKTATARGQFVEAPAGLFAGLDPSPVTAEEDSVVIAQVRLGRSACWAEESAPVLRDRLLREALDFLSYRVRQYLKPLGRRATAPFIPGCPDLAAAAEGIIDGRLSASDSGGLAPAPPGPGDEPHLYLLYTTPRTGQPSDACSRCTRKSCPARSLI